FTFGCFCDDSLTWAFFKAAGDWLVTLGMDCLAARCTGRLRSALPLLMGACAAAAQAASVQDALALVQRDDTGSVISPAVLWALALLVLFALVAALAVLVLRRQVRERTLQLQASVHKLETILDSVGAFIYIKGIDYRYQYA